MKSRLNTRGFTLIEVLVAIAILGVVTTIGLRSFVTITSNWRETRGLVELDDQASGLFQELERDIADILSAELSGYSVRGYDQFIEGDGFNQAADHDDRIVIPVQGAASGRTLANARFVQWRVERDDVGRNALIRTIGPLGSPSPANGRADFAPRANVIRFDISYGTGEESSPWVKSWTSSEHPKAIRVSMTLSDVDNPIWQISRKEVYTVHVR